MANMTQESVFHILYRWYRIFLTLHKIFSQTSTQWAVSSTLSFLWGCLVSRLFWIRIWSLTKKQILTWMMIPLLYLLHLKHFSKSKYKNSLHLINVARDCFPLRWKQTYPLTLVLWCSKVQELCSMVKFTSLLQIQEEKYKKTLF